MAAAPVGQCARVFLDSSKTSACRAQSTLRIWQADQASSARAIWTNLAATNERRKKLRELQKSDQNTPITPHFCFYVPVLSMLWPVLIARSRLNQNMKGEYLVVRHDVENAQSRPRGRRTVT